MLLSRAALMLSDWMAWNAECPYSHAALAVAPDVVLEARMPQVALRSLESVLDEAPARIDLYRPLNPDGSELSQAQQARLLRTGLRLLGVPFALGRMPGLAWRTLLRHKLRRRRSPTPQGLLAASDLSCCELVYLVLRETCGFRIAERSGRVRPRPALRAKTLLREYRKSVQSCKTSWRSRGNHGRVHQLPCDLITTDLVSSPALRYVGTLLPEHR
ncbi:MAG TPA: hypothetical protein VEY92_10595 [Pseudoxanthomonas sp.]|nr:hypothetical protein [Pseudoxanthomonas sp.]